MDEWKLMQKESHSFVLIVAVPFSAMQIINFFAILKCGKIHVDALAWKHIYE